MHADRWARARWLATFCAFLLIATLAPPADVPAHAEPGEVPTVTAGADPQQRGIPANAAPDAAVPEDQRPPIVPPTVEAGGEARKVGRAAVARAAEAAPGEAFTDVLLRPGFVVGDTSLVTYFNLKDQGFERWRVDLFETGSQTRQESVELGKDQLKNTGCGTLRAYCKSLGAAEGWQLDATKSYFVTITALYPDGEVPSANSENAQPRTTIDPPAIPARQAAGCGCSGALGMTGAGQATRGIGVNTGTGAFTRTEQDQGMASFGVPFSSTRAYSSGNIGPSALGSGWAWVYDMKVTATESGALVRAEDGSDTVFTANGDAYVRPPGVRSTLRRAGTGWELVTRNNIVFAFDAQGRLSSILNPRQVGLRFAHTDTSITVTDASGRKAVAKLVAGLIESITLPDGRKTQYFYTDGLLTKVRDAAGEFWQYKYDVAGRLVQVIQPDKIVVLTNEYGADGRVARQLDALGAATTFAWDPGKQESKTTDADNVVVWDGYKGNVLLYSQRGNGDTNNHRYDGSLNRSLVVNANQNQHESAYDPAGNLVEQFAPQRRFSEKTSYDARNNPTSHVDAEGQTWKDDYNQFDELVKSTDPENHSISYTYDGRGLLLTITDQRGKVTRTENIADGQPNAGLLNAQISPEGRRTEFGYDKVGRQLTVTDPRGTVAGAKRETYTTRTVYDALDRTVAMYAPGKKNPDVADFDAVGRLRKTTTAGGVSTSYTYFDNGLPKATYEARRTMLSTYTPAGRRLTSAIDMKHEADLVTSWAYNAKGLVQSTTSPRGNLPGANKADFTTTYVYDNNDNIIQLRRPYPNGQVVTRDYKVDDLDRSVETVDEFGKSAKFDRSNSGQVRSTTDALGRSTSMSYDKNGRQNGITDPKGGQTRTEYDAAGNKIKQISATGGITTYEYTDDGFVSAVTEPRGNVAGADKERFTAHFEYDLAGNQIRGVDALDNVTTRKYDPLNRTVSATDANNHTTRYTYTEDNQPRTVTAPDAEYDADDPEEDSTHYEYGEDGSLSAMTDPRGNRSPLYYDEAGRLIRSTDPLERSTYAKYDAEGNRIQAITLGDDEEIDELSTKERAKRTIVDTYDIVGRRVQRALGSEGPAYSWGYDAKDRITSYGDPTGRRDVAYDDEDQVRTVTRKTAGRADEVFGYDYDERGNVTDRQYPDGTTVSYGYDAASRITSLSAQGAAWSFGYDVAGRRTSTTLPGPTGLTEQRAYDDGGRLTSIGTERTGVAVPGVQDPISKYELTLDAVGNPNRVVTTRGGVAESVAYSYDKADRITSACYAVASCTDKNVKPAGRIDYRYDLNGNRTEQVRTGAAGNDVTEYEYDDADQLTEEEVEGPGHERETEYKYDARGNQIKAGGDRLEYNLDNSLAKATLASGQSTTFNYDAVGLRVSSTSTFQNETSTQRWSWDVAGTLPQIAIDTVENSAGAVVEKRGFTYGPDDEPLALLDPASGVHSYTHDWLGGTANLLTPAGTVEEGYDYDPFGNPREGPTLAGQNLPGQSIENPMQFTGQYQDSTSGDGNYYLRARNYDPGTGRFSSRDALPTGQGATSAYTYASNNPVAFTDPTGMVPEAGDTTGAAPAVQGPSPEDLARANQVQSKSTLDVILEAGGQILMEFLGINDILNCLKGDLVACVSMVVGALPWGKIFKAKKIGEAIFRAGKAVVTFFQELKWARAIIRGAADAAEAAKKAAAAAAKAAAEKAAAAKQAAEAAAKKAAAEAAAKAKALAAKAKAKTRKSAADNGGDAPSCPIRRHSFVAGTTVLLADGSSKPIEELEPGDTVQAADPETGESGARQVTHTVRTDDDKHFVDVTVAGTDGGQHTITTTDTHPFWSVTRGKWVNAGDLNKDELLRTSAGTYVQLSAVRSYDHGGRTYDLTVDDLHTYFVDAGGATVLVHNNDEILCETSDLFDEFDVTPGEGFDPTVPSAGDRSYITYAFRNEADEVTYVGRASGRGNPAQVLAGRLSRGHDHFTEGLTPEVIAVQGNYASSRGAEEFFIQGYLQRGASLTNSDPAVGFSKTARGKKSVGYMDSFFTELLG